MLRPRNNQVSSKADLRASYWFGRTVAALGLFTVGALLLSLGACSTVDRQVAPGNQGTRTGTEAASGATTLEIPGAAATPHSLKSMPATSVVSTSPGSGAPRVWGKSGRTAINEPLLS